MIMPLWKSTPWGQFVDRDLTTKEKQKAEMQANREQSQVEFESLGMEYMWCESSNEELFVAFCVVTKLQIVLGTVRESLHLEEEV